MRLSEKIKNTFKNKNLRRLIISSKKRLNKLEMNPKHSRIEKRLIRYA